MTADDRRRWRAMHGVPEPQADLAAFLPVETVEADLANEALPDRHLRLVPPPRR